MIMIESWTVVFMYDWIKMRPSHVHGPHRKPHASESAFFLAPLCSILPLGYRTELLRTEDTLLGWFFTFLKTGTLDVVIGACNLLCRPAWS